MTYMRSICSTPPEETAHSLSGHIGLRPVTNVLKHISHSFVLRAKISSRQPRRTAVSPNPSDRLACHPHTSLCLPLEYLTRSGKARLSLGRLPSSSHSQSLHHQHTHPPKSHTHTTPGSPLLRRGPSSSKPHSTLWMRLGGQILCLWRLSPPRSDAPLLFQRRVGVGAHVRTDQPPLCKELVRSLLVVVVHHGQLV